VGIIGNLLDVYASFNPAIAIMGTLGLIALIVLISQLVKKIVE